MRASLGLLAVFAVGCAAEPSTPSASTENLASTPLLLPTGDTCRGQIGPLAVALADGAYGLAKSKVTVSFTGSTYVRDYVVRIEGPSGTATTYAVELDNDSSFMCQLMKVSPDADGALGDDARSAATAAELDANVPATVTPANDYCASVASGLGRAAAVTAVGREHVEKVTIAAEGSRYAVHVDGKDFFANGETFPNDANYVFELDDECTVVRAGFN